MSPYESLRRCADRPRTFERWFVILSPELSLGRVQTVRIRRPLARD